jgi:drug/metabolite transporter (DMT)-like permease
MPDVSPAVFGLVLAAALLHASWNALLRSGADRRWSMLVMSLAQASACALVLPFLGGMARAGWICAVVSAVLHIGYNCSLVRAYRTGDLGQTYPIARGSSPLLVSVGAWLVAGERLSLPGLAGVALVSCGILGLALRGRRLAVESVPAALATGCFIGAYSVADGLGARVSGHTFAYIAWAEMLGAGLTALVFAVPSSVRRRRPLRVEWLKSAIGGVTSVVAYGVVIWAMGHAPMGMVSALRETSVVFAAVLGRVFLAEKLTARRLAACSVIAGGAACLAYAG